MGRRQDDMVELRLFLTQQFIDVEMRPRWYDAQWVRFVGAALLAGGALAWCLIRLA